MESSNKKIVILGAGFAGIHAARYLASHCPQNTEITLISKGDTIFRPMLPDLVAGKLNSSTINVDPIKLLHKKKINHINASALSIDNNEKEITLSNKQKIFYDLLLVCCGSIPAASDPKRLSLMEIEDAQKIHNSILKKKNKHLSLLVVGGGYTGIELISAIKALCKKIKLKKNKLQLIVRGSRILSGLNPWEQKKSARALEKAKIDVCYNSTLEIKPKSISLNKEKITPDIICMATGVKAVAGTLLPKFADKKSGRLIVNQYLQVTNSIYAAGDSALFSHNLTKPLRQSVNFAIMQARAAAKNIIGEIKNKKKHAYKPKDLGFVVPNYATHQAYGRSGPLYLSGRFGMLAHYLMCIIRAFSWKQRVRMLRELLFGRKKTKR